MLQQQAQGYVRAGCSLGVEYGTAVSEEKVVEAMCENGADLWSKGGKHEEEEVGVLLRADRTLSGLV